MATVFNAKTMGISDSINFPKFVAVFHNCTLQRHHIVAPIITVTASSHPLEIANKITDSKYMAHQSTYGNGL